MFVIPILLNSNKVLIMFCFFTISSSSLAILAFYSITRALAIANFVSNSMIYWKGSIAASIFGMPSSMVGLLPFLSYPNSIPSMDGKKCGSSIFLLSTLSLRVFSDIFSLIVTSIWHLTNGSQLVCSLVLEVFDQTTLVFVCGFFGHLLTKATM